MAGVARGKPPKRGCRKIVHLDVPPFWLALVASLDATLAVAETGVCKVQAESAGVVRA